MTNNIFGRNIKLYRLSNNLTLKDLSKKAGISISFLSDIENGRSKPSLEKLKDIAESLGTTVSVLMGENPSVYGVNGSIPSQGAINRDEQVFKSMIDDAEFKCLYKYIYDFPEWDDDDKKELLNYLKIKRMLRENKKAESGKHRKDKSS